MTTVKLSIEGERLVYDAKGHAQDPKVCAAISMISGALAGWAVNYGMDPEHSEKDGHVYVAFDISRESLAAYRVAEIGLLQLQKIHGKELKVISE